MLRFSTCTIRAKNYALNLVVDRVTVILCINSHSSGPLVNLVDTQVLKHKFMCSSSMCNILVCRLYNGFQTVFREVLQTDFNLKRTHPFNLSSKIFYLLTYKIHTIYFHVTFASGTAMHTHVSTRHIFRILY